MIIRGKSVGRPSSSVSVQSKVFTDLINNIEDSDLLVMDSVDLLTIINQGILPNNDAIKSIFSTISHHRLIPQSSLYHLLFSIHLLKAWLY